MKHITSLSKLLLAFCLIIGTAGTFSPTSVHAVLFDWDISATFSDSSSATGGFSFDDVSGNVFNVSISYTGCPTCLFVDDRVFSQVAVSSNSFITAVSPSDGPPYGGSPVFVLGLDPGFAFLNSSLDGIDIQRCFDAACTVTAGQRVIGISTTVVGQVAAVPEPGTIILFASGLLGLAGYRWHQRRREGSQVG